MARDWIGWHEAYERPDSSLTARLAVVTRLIAAGIDRTPPGPVRCLSLCAGDARDLAGALARHDRGAAVSGAVIELDSTLADRARDRLASVAPRLDVRTGDAGTSALFADVVPVDVLVLVGIFGNISDDDIRVTIRAVPALCRPGATVVWSRHRREPDATPMIRRTFDEIGARSVAFESPGAETFAVGAEQVGESGAAMEAPALPDRLFGFRDDLW